MRQFQIEKGDTLMNETPTYNELNRIIKELEKEALTHLKKERDHNEEMKLIEYKMMKRSLSLLSINNELIKEIKEIRSADKKEFELISHKLERKIKELNCLYRISSLRVSPHFSVDHIFQNIVDFIPKAMEHSELTCARIVFDHSYEIKTKNFKKTRWKRLQEIKLNNERIGTIEVCCLVADSDLDNGLYLERAASLTTAIAEIVAQIVERERAENEIRRGRSKIEEMIRQGN